jgi:hypothetical protein
MKTNLAEVLKSLNSAGFQREDICVFLSPTHPIADGVRNLKAPDASSTLEIDLGPTFAWLSTFGSVVIPGVGFLVGSHEYLRALGQADCAPDATGNGAALASLGIPEDDAIRYETHLRRDANLVFVNCDGAAKSEWAREILRRMRAEEVCVLGEFNGLADQVNGFGLPVTI